MRLALPVSVRVIAVRSFGRTPLLRVSAAIISEDTEPGVAKARAADFAEESCLEVKTDSHGHPARDTKYTLSPQFIQEAGHAVNNQE